ncbi:MAG: 16S rRNA (cytosine(1402)-N(4))-methyltransferase RsmH [Planctomycetota bacterium]|nr:16S rRNA (cytosine(1402)-N(4))-methyltransferase [Planctomycetota bacterium]MEE2713787.1 16S rRNA (cytosine(1402)-N(4))-methyltransferase RsmH [Planctomycetota bacterium]
MTDKRLHEPVLEEAVIDRLAPEPGDVMVDLTVGAGGHASRILGRVGAQGRVIGVDRDPAALEVARRVLAPFGDRAILVEGCSDTLRAMLRAAGVDRVQGVLLDLGVSSMQLDDPVRGFSFRHDGPLSMRMGKGPGVKSAMKLLQDSTVSELERILREYGEEPSARRLASRLKDLCRRRPPRTTLELANFIESLHPHRPRGRSVVHPATRVFQALRIAVNDEIGVLERTLPQAVEALTPGGRLAVISFQSLDDRIVKRFMRDGYKAGTFDEITKKPIRPEEDELARNPRSRSARLRVAVRRKDDAAA